MEFKDKPVALISKIQANSRFFFCSFILNKEEIVICIIKLSVIHTAIILVLTH